MTSSDDEIIRQLIKLPPDLRLALWDVLYALSRSPAGQRGVEFLTTTLLRALEQTIDGRVQPTSYGRPR